MKITFDLDGTLCELRKEGQTYEEVKPIVENVKLIKKLKQAGNYIIIYTARHMKTCNNDAQKVINKVGAITKNWLAKYKIKYDELIFGKPFSDIYVDDSCLRSNSKKIYKQDYFNNNHTNILIPIAGEGNRFKNAGYIDPKPFIKVNGKYLIEYSVASLGLNQSLFDYSLYFIYKTQDNIKYDFLEKLKKTFKKYNPQFIEIPHPTRGQLETCVLAKNYIDNFNRLIIFNCDTFILPNLNESHFKSNIDAYISVFYSNNPQYSYCALDKYGFVKETAEKKVISNYANTGLYYFRFGNDFISYASDIVNNNAMSHGEFYIAPLFNRYISEGKKVKIIEASKVTILGTPDEIDDFKKRHHKSLEKTASKN